jgi:hypothetical protein
MSADFEQQAPISAYGKQRRAAWMAQLQANADAMRAASLEAHQAHHEVVTASKQGIFGHSTPEQMAATVAARPATVGTAWGQGRPVERNGGQYDHNLGPAPARVDLRNVDRQGQEPGMSPLLAHMRGQQ